MRLVDQHGKIEAMRTLPHLVFAVSVRGVVYNKGELRFPDDVAVTGLHNIIGVCTFMADEIGIYLDHGTRSISTKNSICVATTGVLVVH